MEGEIGPTIVGLDGGLITAQVPDGKGDRGSVGFRSGRARVGGRRRGPSNPC